MKMAILEVTALQLDDYIRSGSYRSATEHNVRVCMCVS